MSSPEGLTEKHWEILRQLQADGHEIGCHGYRHQGVISFKTDEGIDVPRFFVEEVLPALALLVKNGFCPVSYAYSGGFSTPEVDAMMLRYFKVVRTTQGNKAKYSGRRTGGAIGALSLDRPWKLSDIDSLLDEVKRDGSVMVFAGHRMGNRGHYWTAMEELETIARVVGDKGLRFYTMSELASDLPNHGPVSP